MSTFLLNFRSQFEEEVSSGRKRQTIRRERADGKRPTTADVVHCYVGLRTRGSRLIKKGQVISCDDVTIDPNSRWVSVNSKLVSSIDMPSFARADGFDSAQAFFDFFAEAHGGRVEGFLVKWAPQS